MVKVSGWALPKARSRGPPFITKSQIAAVLEQVGVLLELDGANRFRVLAYQNASRALASGVMVCHFFRLCTFLICLDIFSSSRRKS